jgi:hypothetical protein
MGLFFHRLGKIDALMNFPANTWNVLSEIYDRIINLPIGKKLYGRNDNYTHNH